MHIAEGLHRAVLTNRNGIASVDRGAVRTWIEMQSAVRRLTGGLASKSVGVGDRVAILASNSARQLECFYAIPSLGAITVPLNWRWSDREIEDAIKDCEPKLILADAQNLSRVAKFAESGISVLQLGEDTDRLIAESEERASVDQDAGSTAMIFYTGGTTGGAKGVMLSHRNIVTNAIGICAAFRLPSRPTWLHLMPMFHVGDGVCLFSITMLGGTHVFIEKFDPIPVFETIQRHRISCTNFVPSMLSTLMNHPERDRYDLTSIERVLYGASPIPSELMARFMREFMSWQFFQGYGMTEATALAVSLPWDEHHLHGPLAKRRESAGRPVLGVEIRIADNDDAEVPTGTIGEVLIRGDLVMNGYWRRLELTKQTLRDGWLHSGDLGYRDEDGFVYIVDRKKDMIITGGENVYSTEVESAIYAHPSVAECAVIGLPSDRWGELVHAVVVPKEGAVLGSSDIIEHCRTYVGGYKCPKSVTIRYEGLPKSGAGKVLKKALREELASQSELA